MATFEEVVVDFKFNTQIEKIAELNKYIKQVTRTMQTALQPIVKIKAQTSGYAESLALSNQNALKMLFNGNKLTNNFDLMESSIGNVGGVIKTLREEWAEMSKVLVAPVKKLNLDQLESQISNFAESSSAFKEEWREMADVLTRKIPKKVLLPVDETSILSNLNAFKRVRVAFIEDTGQWRNALGRFTRVGLAEMMAMPLEQFRTLDARMLSNVTTFGRWGYHLRRATHGLRGFRMEFLSVMFFGMQLQRTFIGLLTPAMKAVGIFDLWGQTLKVLFLPVALILLEKVILPIAMWLMNLSDRTKKFIGWLVVFGAVVGTVLFLAGMLGLAFGGIFIALGPIIAGIVTLGPAVAVLTAKILAVGIAFATLMTFKDKIIGFFKGMVANGIRDIKTWEGFIKFFVGIVKTGWGVLKEATSDIWTKIASKISGIVDGIKSWVLDKLGTLLSRIGDLPIIVPTAKLFGSMWKWIKDFIGSEDKFNFLKDTVVGWFDDLREHSEFTDAVGNFAERIWTKIKSVIEGIKDFGSAIKKMIENVLPSEWKEIATYVATELADGIKKALKEKLTNIRFRPTSEIVAELKVMLTKEASKYDDFVMRPGQPPIPFSSEDTIIGTKTPLSGGTNITFSPTITVEVNASSDLDIDTLTSKLSEEWVDKLNSMIRER